MDAMTADALTVDALTGTLAEASWRVADAALAEAWRDMHHLDALLARSSRRPAALLDECAAAFDAVARAARARGFMRSGEVGEVVGYDAALHDDEGRAFAPGTLVRILAPGVGREVDGRWEALARARVRKAAPRPSRPAPRRASEMRAS